MMSYIYDVKLTAYSFILSYGPQRESLLNIVILLRIRCEFYHIRKRGSHIYREMLQ